MHFSTGQFVKSGTNSFVQELSTLAHGKPLFGHSAAEGLFHKIYPDACDAGITITSERTGNKATYYLNNENGERDGEGELTHWLLKPTRETLRSIPTLEGSTVTIFND